MIRHILFDLDNTLYEEPGHRDEMDRRIERYFREKLGLDADRAHEVRVKYRERYGTALRGLMIHHSVDPVEFLHYVHRGLPAQYVKPWPEAREVLEKAGFPLSVFSNAPEDYIQRMLQALGLSDLFARVFGIEASSYVGKPDPEAYRCVLRELSLEGPECLLVEDTASNLGPAKALGMKTVFLGKDGPPLDHKSRGEGCPCRLQEEGGHAPPERTGPVDFHVRSFGELKDIFQKIREETRSTQGSQGRFVQGDHK